MSITPPSIIQPEGNPPPGGAPTGSPTQGTAAPLWAVIVLGVVSLGGLGGMFYYAQSLNDRLDQVNASLQSALSAQSAQGETLGKLGGRLDQGDTRAEELQGQVAQTQNRLGIKIGRASCRERV